MIDSGDNARHRQWISAMPKAEQHLHLEGSIRPGITADLARRHGVEIPDSGVNTFTDFDGFLTAFLAGLDLLRTAGDFADITVALASELAAQNVVYAEVTTTPFNHHRRGIDMTQYRQGLDEGRTAARKLGVDIGWILDIPRELEPPDTEFTANFILSDGCPEGVVGIGLGGPEVGWPAGPFDVSFSRVRAAGLASLPHAGETEGPDSVWEAIRALGADRIGHGVRSIDDPLLVEYLAEQRIPLEVSMTSNVCTGVAASIEEHPIRRLSEQGVIVTINTDDPAYFFTDLTTELIQAHEIQGFSVDELAGMQQAAIATSYCSNETRTRFDTAMADWSRTRGA